ncbi:hypothetical protein AK812_SmicGene45729, partial [Symbiodinium microadriaticum]
LVLRGRQAGLGKRINMIMQTVFFKLSLRARWLESLLATCGVLTVVFPALWGAFFRNFGCGGWGGFLDADRGSSQWLGFVAEAPWLSLSAGIMAGDFGGERALCLGSSGVATRSSSFPCWLCGMSCTAGGEEAAPMVQIVASHCEPFSSAPYSALLAQLQGEIAKMCRSNFTEFLEQWAAHQTMLIGGLLTLSGTAIMAVGPSWDDAAAAARDGADAWFSWAGPSVPSWGADALEGARAGRAVSYYGASAKGASADSVEPVRVVTSRHRWDECQGADANGAGEPCASKARWKKRRGKADTPGTWRLDERVWKASTAIGFAYSAASFSHELDVSSGVACMACVCAEYQADKDEERATDLSLRFPVTSDASELPDWADGGYLCSKRAFADASRTFPSKPGKLWSSRSRLFHCLFFVLPLVVRASFDKAFGEDHWEDIVRKPSHFARLWTGASGVAQAGVIDAFGFQRSGTRITGMLRLRTSDAASRLWKCSGQLANGTRWFIDLVGDAEDLTFAQDVGVQWLPWTSDETYGDYMARAAAKAGLGLVLGRGIGVRMNRSDPSYQRPSVMWRMRSIPSHFMMTDVKELAEAMGFEAVVMSTRHRTRRGHDWCFRAVRGDALQIVSQTVQWDPDDPSTSEVVVLKESARRGTRMSAGEAIAEPRTVTFNDALAVARGPGAPKRAARKARAVDERRAPSVPDGPGESMTVDSEGRAPGDQWGPPGEWLTNDGQGNCLVLALSQLDLGGRERTHRQLRRFIVAAFQEYRSDLEPLWQKAGRFNTIGRFPHDGHAFSWSPLPLSTSSELVPRKCIGSLTS